MRIKEQDQQELTSSVVRLYLTKICAFPLFWIVGKTGKLGKF